MNGAVETAVSPLPWVVGGLNRHQCGVNIDSRERLPGGGWHLSAVGIAGSGDPHRDRANAEFIVRAVNNHAALVAALDEMLDGAYGVLGSLESQGAGPVVLGYVRGAIKRAQKVVTAATGRPFVPMEGSE